ncbi:nicotinamide-nucleotide amidohydrolase family protein [Bombilactobacillus bombi]|uniref:Uncharacterized protein n=1 Tax=Bombilactobacillus bombi TaxID=1303590 RepID=A0A347SS13_9LACO|nr:nicotinamide-nucleotide amidohydrolase family protein [Bombilactobacillus bombi]AXX64822.1 nicotinamide-nucleotide amidohydrolase family protein [Bombilactobacillus bombi]RHW47379.1 hypothetical protein DS832_04335 [Bombilactobacillus bombi]
MQELLQEFKKSQTSSAPFVLEKYDSLFQFVVKQLTQQKQTITAAESLTAGLFQATLASVPGASKVLEGGFITYSLKMKAQLLDIPATKLQEHGVVSQWTAMQMAIHSAQIVNSNFGVGLTGAAGPESLEGHAAGTVWIAVNSPTTTVAQQFKFAGNRADVRKKSVVAAFNMVANSL